MSPIHIRADPTDLAPIALLVGDPGRAHRIAERLDRPQLYNDFRGLIGYTGDFDGTPNSVQTTGMGGPRPRWYSKNSRSSVCARRSASAPAAVLVRRSASWSASGDDVRLSAQPSGHGFELMPAEAEVRAEEPAVSGWITPWSARAPRVSTPSKAGLSWR